MSPKAKPKADPPETPPAAADSPPSPPEAPAPPVTTTRSIKVRLTPPHSEAVLDWCTFAAAVAALAERIPPGVNPTVHVRYGTITATWPE